MTRVALCVAVVVAALAGGAAGGSCNPLACGPSQVALAHGALLGVRPFASGPLRVVDLRTGRTRWRLPGGALGGNLLVHADGTLITWFDAATGARVADAVLQERGTHALVGASLDGRRAVLARTESRSTTFALVSRYGQHVVSVPGNTWQFDALAGHLLFLTHWMQRSYEVRVVDLARDGLRGGALGERLRGTAWGRVVTGDVVATLYVGPRLQTMLHLLDTRRATARCVDLRLDDGGASAALVADGPRVWVVDLESRRVIGVDASSARVVASFSADFGITNATTPVAAVAKDGQRIAVSDGTHVWVVDTAARTVRLVAWHVAIAVGWGGARSLWVLGERSRFSRLQLR